MASKQIGKEGLMFMRRGQLGARQLNVGNKKPSANESKMERSACDYQHVSQNVQKHLKASGLQVA